jgi:5-methylcytosine-specific restriction enzyme subunit McrC
MISLKEYMRVVVAEFGWICGASATFEGAVVLPQKTFELLKKIAFTTSAEGVLGYVVRRGKEAIQVKNHLGLLQLADGTQLEILPKTHPNATDARAVFLRMLQALPNTPFKSLTTAQMTQCQLPLFEILVVAFLNELEKICQQGLQKNYASQEKQTTFLKGKWLINKQLNKNIASSFYTIQSQFLTDIIPNQLLKTTLLYLQNQPLTIQTQTRLLGLLTVFEQVQMATNVAYYFSQIQNLDRRFDRYATALQWAKVLFNQQSWAGAGTAEALPALLFRSERLFETFVTQQFKKHTTDYDVVVQDTSQYLIDNHNGRPRFNIRPDLLLKNSTKTIVIDIKWKYISPTTNALNYGIDQSDLYQLYAYGQKHKADALYLIYPAHDTFQAPLPTFWYDNERSLTVLPIDVLSNFQLFITTFMMVS